MQKSPYKFLDSYSKEDRDIFFGRDKEIEELHSRVFVSRILVVYGTSGTGKSSLINCGLANKFNDSDWLPVTVRRGLNINQSLSDSLDKASITGLSSVKKDLSGGLSGNIAKIIQSIYLDHFKPVYIIFDQFEELFIFGSNEEKDELISSVKNVLYSDLQCRFIFSVREEYLAGFTEFEKVIPSFLSNRIRIEKMTRQNAIQVIEGPCRLNGIDIEAGFSEKLLDKLNPGNPEVELTWLQVYIDKIFRIATKEDKKVRMIGSGLLDEVGEVKDLLGTFLEEQISKLDDPESGLVILKSFVSVKGTRQLITAEEVIEYSKTIRKELEGDKVKDLLQKFIRLRILRDKDENGRYELRHDSLAAKIYENITLVEKELLEIRQFLDNAWNSYQKRQLYLTSEDLSYIAPYEDKLFLNEKVQRFIAQSKREMQKARHRRQNIFISTAAIVIIILTFFTVWAFRERGNALDQKKVADEQRTSALVAKRSADLARMVADTSRKIAEEKERQALRSQMESEVAKNEAIAERRNAFEQKNRAEASSEIALEQARIATEEKSKAEQATEKAVEAEAEASRLNLLSVAQNLALKSVSIERDPELMGLLAVQAYTYNKSNGGKSEDPIIYEALNKSFMTLDSLRHSIFEESPDEIRILTERSNGILYSADMDGQIRSWTPAGKSTYLFTLSFRSPINFIGSGSTGEKVITQHDNKALLLWDTREAALANSPFLELKGQKGFVRTAAFSIDEKILATAGRDSTLSIWDLDQNNPSPIRSVKTGSGVRALVFITPDTLIFAQEDGSIVLWDVMNDKRVKIFSSESDKTLSLAWNDKRKTLFAGCSNGTLLLLDLKQGRALQAMRLPVHTSGIDLISFNSDFSLMATSCWDRTIKFYYYHDFFDHGNSVGGSEHLRNIDSRARAMLFTRDNRLAAGMSDRRIHVWETSSDKLASMVCNLLKREMTAEEWKLMVGEDIPYEKSCHRAP
jgi:WD40 repeat protein